MKLIIKEFLKEFLTFDKQKRRHYLRKNKNRLLKIKKKIFNNKKNENVMSYKLMDLNKLDQIKSLYNEELDKIAINFNSKKWYTNDFDVNENIIEVNSDAYTYTTYLGKSNNFNTIFENESIRLSKGVEYTFSIDVFVNGSINTDLALICYQNKKKEEVHFFNINSLENGKVSFVPRNNYDVRLAIRAKGQGKLLFSGIEISNRQIQTENKRMPLCQDNRVKDYKNLNVALISDTFTSSCLSKEFNIVQFTPDNFKEKMSESNIDFLFVESTWKGYKESWQYKIGKYANQDKSEIKSVLKFCKDNNIPTCFWNKEDPIHFDKFIDTARLFDYIYTTDSNMIEKYKEACGHNNVFCMQFSIQPDLHNPIKIAREKIDKFCFAGSYYANRHEDRRRDMDLLFNEAHEYGLDIFDRNYEKNKEGETDFSFPKSVRDSVIGVLPYNKINIAYKGYKYMLNVNSIQDSPTMFSRRVFEGMACGTPVISTYSKGIKETFVDLVRMSETKAQLEQDIKEITKSNELYDRIALQGIREVFTKHTYKHRFLTLIDNMKLTIQEQFPMEIGVIAVIRNESEFDRIYDYFTRQTYENKKLYVFAENFIGFEKIISEFNKSDVQVYSRSYAEKVYMTMSEMSNSDFYAYFDCKNYYGQNYLSDLMICKEYVKDADVIGKRTFFKGESLDLSLENNEYCYTTCLDKDRSIISRTKMENHSIEELLDENDTFFNEVSFASGTRFFSVDKYNFIENYCESNYENRVEF